jgi:hypothetical protein
MYQIFAITLKPKEVTLRGHADKIDSLGWYLDGAVLVKEDDGLQYILDLSTFTLKCLTSDLFPIAEGKWTPKEFPSREELVNSAIAHLRKLPLNLEINEVRRIVTHE